MAQEVSAEEWVGVVISLEQWKRTRHLRHDDPRIYAIHDEVKQEMNDKYRVYLGGAKCTDT